MKTIAVFSVLISALLKAAGQQPELVMDINQGSGSSYIMYMTTIGNKVVFKATNNGNTNNEPWVSDGTAEGTIMLKEINPSTVTGSSMFNVVSFHNEVYFSANDGENGSELWKTDGTPEGTVMVKDIAPGVTSSQPGELTVFKDAVYFRAYHPDTGSELWKTEGTEATTGLVADLTDAGASTKPGYLFATSDYIYFIDLDDHTLYRSDGTTAGSTLLSDDIIVGQLDNAWFTEYSGAVYFRATEKAPAESKGQQLWRVSGSSVERVTQIVSEEADLDPRHLIVSNNKLFFTAEQYPYGDELWVYDGTARMVKDINPSGHGNLGGFFADCKGKLVFSAGTTGPELWVSDGTESGTKLVMDIWPGSIGSGIVAPVTIGDTLYFTANDGTGTEIWRLLSPDGLPEKFTNLAGMGADCSELVRINKTFFFNGGDAATGTELWKMNYPGSTGVYENIESSLNIKLYPNPTTGHLTIEIPEIMPLPVNISIFTSSGRQVLDKEMETNPCEFCFPDGSKPGIYLLKVTSKGGSIIKKVLLSGL